MARLKATKTSLYKLVKDYAELPSMKRVRFNKTPRSPSYLMRWCDSRADYHAFFASCVGTPLLTIEIREDDLEGNVKNTRQCHRLTVEDLRARGMIEEYEPKKGATS